MEWAEFWGGFGAIATGSAALSGLIAWLVALVVARRSRPEANWVVLRRDAHRYDIPSAPKVMFEVVFVNAGDDSAFAIRLSGKHCEVWQLSPAVVVPAGEAMTVRGTCERDDPERAAIVVEWTRRPTRLHRTVRHTEVLAGIEVTVFPVPPGTVIATGGPPS